MTECIKPACDLACASTCDVAALAEKVTALETALKEASQGPSFSDNVKYIIENSTGILALAGAIAALIAVLAIVLFIRRRLAPADLMVKSATLTVAGTSISVEAAAQELSDFVADMQDYIVRDAARAPFRLRRAIADGLASGGGLTDAQSPAALTAFAAAFSSAATQPENTFSAAPVEADPLPSRSILWVAQKAEAIRFETMVLRHLGNDLRTVTGPEDATILLRSGVFPDLLVLDLTAGAEAEEAGLPFAAHVLRGLKGYDHIESPPILRVGPAFRLAVLAAGGRAARVSAALARATSGLPEDRLADITANLLVTDSFYVLKERVEWLQEQAAASP